MSNIELREKHKLYELSRRNRLSKKITRSSEFKVAYLFRDRPTVTASFVLYIPPPANYAKGPRRMRVKLMNSAEMK